MFALFVDVMGVQQALVGSGSGREAAAAFGRCRERLEDFHRDLADTIGRDLPLLLAGLPTIPEPSFLAEFSDSAYVVSERFGSVAAAALLLMRRALRHEYPLRGGIGVGTFSHETSGVRTNREGQVWSTSSFLGSAVVTAYQAEHSLTPGLRVFIHPSVLRRNTEPLLQAYATPLPMEERSPCSSHELRFWRAAEAAAAAEKLLAFRDKQELADRPLRHYDATHSAYGRFDAIKKDLPLAPPALWLWPAKSGPLG
jgi:hypothetical protein